MHPCCPASPGKTSSTQAPPCQRTPWPWVQGHLPILTLRAGPSLTASLGTPSLFPPTLYSSPSPRGKPPPGLRRQVGSTQGGGTLPGTAVKPLPVRGCPLLPALTRGWLMWLGWEALPES